MKLKKQYKILLLAAGLVFFLVGSSAEKQRLFLVQLINSPFPQKLHDLRIQVKSSFAPSPFRAGIVLRYIITSLMSITSTVLSDANLCSGAIVTENTAGCKME